jgi:hypothetical protein
MRTTYTAYALSLLLAFGTVAGAATVDVIGFGSQGWRSDDTRDTTGADLVGLNYTNAPKPGVTPTAAADLAIAQQIKFVDTDGVSGPSGSTYGGAVSIDGTSSNSGKSNISVLNLAGFGPGSDLVGASSPFYATYEWQNVPVTSRTLGFKLGIQSSQWASSQAAFTATRSGESAWDLVLVHLPAASDNVWSTVNVDHDSGGWLVFRQAGNVFFPAPPNVTDVNGRGTMTLDDWANDATYGPLLFGPGAKVTSVQFGLGSSQRNSISYVDYLQTNLISNGDVLNFTTPEPGSLALLGIAAAAAIARRRRVA